MKTEIILNGIFILSLFTLIYLVLYRRSVYYSCNRIYLLSTAMLSFAIPYLHFDIFPEVIRINQTFKRVSGKETVSNVGQTPLNPEMDIISQIYWVGVGIALLLVIYQSFILMKSIISAEVKHKKQGRTLIHIGYYASFFHFIFIGTNDPVKLNHEFQHSRRWHSLDRVLFDILLCFTWFNPLMYVYRYLIIENHEFEADQLTISNMNLSKAEYGQIMIDAIKKTPSFTPMLNPFHSLIKNRIKMLTQQNSKKAAYYLMVPLILSIFSAFTFKSYPVYQIETNDNNIDTLPGTIKLTDTIAVFDPETMKESLKVVESEQPLEDYLRDLELKNGKFYYTMDTIVFFDTDTYTEIVSTIKTRYPEGLKTILNLLNESQRIEVLNKYSEQQTYNTSADQSGNVYLFSSDSPYTLRAYEGSNFIKAIDIKPDTRSISMGQLKLSKGKYKLKRSDTADEISIQIVE